MKERETKITLTMPWCQDFMLIKALKTAMEEDWKNSLFMLNHGYNKEVPYFGERIDFVADMLLQVMAQIKD